MDGDFVAFVEIVFQCAGTSAPLSRVVAISGLVVNKLRIYEEKGTRGFMSKTPPCKSKDPSAPTPKKSQVHDLPAILAENEYLRMENEYLKKLRALILEQELQNLSEHK